MKVKLFQLGTLVTDMATKAKGMLTHAQIDGSGIVHYLMQPKGLSKEDGLPLPALWLNGNRIQGGVEITEDVPAELLGNEVEDMASGFKGVAVELVKHVSGCFHITMQSGKRQENGALVAPYNCDLRRCKGKGVPVITPEKLKVEEKVRPSPSMPRVLTTRMG